MATSVGATPARAGTARAKPAWWLLRCVHLEILPGSHQAYVDRRPLDLTSREFQLLLALAERRNLVVARSVLYALVWGQPMRPRDRSVDVFVRRLRCKLWEASPGWTYIHTHVGVGYRFAPVRAPRSARSLSS
jgi:DNA-binding response OmpR family regulator